MNELYGCDLDGAEFVLRNRRVANSWVMSKSVLNVSCNIIVSDGRDG